MICGAVDQETNELILTVDGDGLLDFARILSRGQSIKLPMKPSKNQPGLPIQSLSIVVNEAKTVVIDATEGKMSITGGPHALATLGEQLLEFGVMNDLYEPGMHTHFDAEPKIKASVIAIGSTPLVIYGPCSE